MNWVRPQYNEHCVKKDCILIWAAFTIALLILYHSSPRGCIYSAHAGWKEPHGLCCLHHSGVRCFRMMYSHLTQLFSHICEDDSRFNFRDRVHAVSCLNLSPELSFPPKALCSRARRSACTQWPISVMSSTDPLPTNMAITTNGPSTLARFPTHVLEQYVWITASWKILKSRQARTLNN